MEKLEIGLSSFSYEELGTEEAGKLKRSFDIFRTGLEDKVFGVPEMKQLDVIYEQVGIQASSSSLIDESFTKADSITQLLTLIALLDKTNLDQRQREIVRALHKVGKRLKNDDSDQSKTTVQNNQLLIGKNLESLMTTSKVNLKPVLEECMGQMELLEELVRIYKQNVLEFIGKIKVHLQTENFRGVDFACQKIQACLKMMKTVSLLEITEQMSTVCKTDNDIKYLNFLYQQFLVEYPKVEELVDFEIDVLRNM
ncbi:hypothetical protein [Flagellimonas algicola]|uniref:Uncharacterized protein n=1 Tax=Flagellimonas algicola TaxID=2583815 RepID=A0ABY2WNW2_9FLAO|nr:hypothetical protein [Allomuricauda algicola]TMU56425.1 hypothetical protein FGG15_02465 [Allomuricauda algicola]